MALNVIHVAVGCMCGKKSFHDHFSQRTMKLVSQAKGMANLNNYVSNTDNVKNRLQQKCAYRARVRQKRLSCRPIYGNINFVGKCH